MGTPDFAVPAMEALSAAGHQVCAAVCQPDKPKGRHSELTPPPVKLAAEKHGIPVLQPRKVRDEAFIDALRALAPDAIIVAAYGKILPKEILELPRYGCINIHASLLPRWRGAAPIQWAVISGDKETGITIMQMDEGLDTGDMLMQERIILNPDETSGSLFERLAACSGPLIVKALEALQEGALKAVPQPKEGVCYAPKIEKELGNIDWSRPAGEIECLVRGLTPWPGAYSHLNGRLFKIHRTACPEREEIRSLFPELFDGASDAASFGKVLASPDHSRLFVCCKDVPLELLEVQLEGKRRMSAAEFLRGAAHILEGDERFLSA